MAFLPGETRQGFAASLTRQSQRIPLRTQKIGDNVLMPGRRLANELPGSIAGP